MKEKKKEAKPKKKKGSERRDQGCHERLRETEVPAELGQEDPVPRDADHGVGKQKSQCIETRHRPSGRQCESVTERMYEKGECVKGVRCEEVWTAGIPCNEDLPQYGSREQGARV